MIVEEETISVIQVKKNFTKGKEIKIEISDISTEIYNEAYPTKDDKILAFVDKGSSSPAKIVLYSINFSKKLEAKVEKCVDAFNYGSFFNLKLDPQREYVYVLSKGNKRYPEGIRVFSLKDGLKLVSEVKLQKEEIVVDFCFAGNFGDSGIIMTFSEMPIPFAVTCYEFCSKKKVVFERKDLRYEKKSGQVFFSKTLSNGNGKVLLVSNQNERIDLELKE